MAVLLGTTGNDSILDDTDGNIIFGDPFTEGNFLGFPGNGAILSSGRGGDDYVDGDSGQDYIIGDAAIITGNARGGDDHLIGGSGGFFSGEFGEEHTLETISGDADVVISGSARGGDDCIDGGDGADYLVGDSLDLIDNARGGDDHIVGGNDTDFLFGDADFEMKDKARGGDDCLRGDSGDDMIFGDNGWLGISGKARSGADHVLGGSGDDVLIGDGMIMSGKTVAGDDVLVGGIGNDLLYGDADPLASDLANVKLGHDRFVFRNGSGLDTIFDFGDDQDVVDLRNFGGIDRFSEVRAASTQAGDDVVIDLGQAADGPAGVNVVTLADFDIADLNARDFLLA